MGFFDFLFGGSQESQLKRHAKRVINLNTQVDDREASAQWLADEGSPQAIFAMLKRFGLNYEHRMKDTQEKERIFLLLERLGQQAVQPSKDWMRKNVQFAYPLRLITQIEGQEKTILFLLELLALENDDFSPQKKLQILSHLQRHKHERIGPSVIPLLTDFNEDVRFATIEVMAIQQDPQTREPLLDQMTKEASNRLRHRIATIFTEANWNVSPHAEKIANHIPVGFRLEGENFILDE